MNEMPSLGDFSALLGGKFLICHDDGKQEVELIEVKPLKAYPKAPRQEPYSLLFRGPKDFYLPQRLYVMEHQTLGTRQFFLVPIQPDEEGSYFESLVN